MPSKLARWIAACGVGIGAASACGGRSELLPGELDEQAGASATAGVGGASAGGRSPMAGAPAAGGFTTGGLSLGGGGLGGTAGGAMVCKPGSSECRGNTVLACDSSGSSLSTQACAEGLSCFLVDEVAQCLTCEPYSRQCGSGNDALACSGDGTSWNTVVNCEIRGQRCYFDGCRSLSCLPGQAFCGPTGLYLCGASGTISALTQDCDSGLYCNPTTLACEAGVCAPGQPSCNGTLATTCSADGSGYVAGGDDCSTQPGRQCIDGLCQCRPGLANCNDDATDGCETDVASDPNNCLTCATTCSSSHVSEPTCDNGCNGKCDAGFGDCNEDKVSDGCETDLRDDDDNCGEWGRACDLGEGCVNGSCKFTR